MNLSQLYYYRMLTRCHNYKKAAAELFISEPTLSVAIKKLEKELGCELLQRKRHTIELTADGEEFAECVEQVLQNLDNHVNAIKQRSEQRNSTLRIGIVLSAKQSLWAALLERFHLAAGLLDPNVLIKQDTTEHLLEALKRDDVDIIITGSLEHDDTMVSFPCWCVSVLAAINKDNPLAQKGRVTFDDLRGCNLISYVREMPLGRETEKLAADFDLTVDYAFKNEPSLSSNVAESKDTVALVCDSWMAYANPQVEIREIADAPKDYHRFWMTYRSNLPKSETMLTRFIDFAKTYDFEQSNQEFEMGNA